MKRWLFILICRCFRGKQLKDEANGWYMMRPLLWAYAGGGSLRRYGNAAEDVEASLKLGFKVIEMDFSRTSDGIPVASHFFKPEDDSSEWSHIPSKEEFLAKPVNGRYTPLTFEDVARRYCHGDYFVSLDPFYYVCNVKKGEMEFYRYAIAHSTREERQQMILQIYSLKTLLRLRKSNEFGAFHYVFGGGLEDGNCWRVKAIIPLLTEAGVRSVSFQDVSLTDRVREAFRLLRVANIRISVAGVNTLVRYRELLAAGVDGVNSMSLTPEQVK